MSKYNYVGKCWGYILVDISFSINIEKQSTTKYSSYYLLFGRHQKVLQEINEIGGENNNLNNENYNISETVIDNNISTDLNLRDIIKKTCII